MREEIRTKLAQQKVNVQKGEESYGDAYEEMLRRFLFGYDFMRIGQAVNSKRWESASMCVRRMSMEADKLGLECFHRQMVGLRQNIAGRNEQEVKNILSLIIVKRIQLQDVLK